MALNDHLEKVFVFRAVALAGSISSATESLNLTQPTISRALKILEDSIGEELFYRKASGVTLTKAGTFLLGFSDRLVAEVATLESQIKTGASSLGGRINIGCYESLATIFLPNALKEFSKKNSNISIGIHTANGSRGLFQKLERAEIDIGISLKINVPKGLLTFPLYMDQFAIYYLPKSYLLKGEKTPTLKGLLQKMPLILIPRAEVSETEDLQRVVWKNNIHCSNIIEVETFDTAKEYVIAGLGAAVLPEVVARKAMQTSGIVKLGRKTSNLHEFEMCAFVRERDQNDVAIRELIERIQLAST